jgi:hypothetical protein
MDIKIKTNETVFAKLETRRRALQKISDTVEDDVLLFLASLTEKKDINNKLRNNQFIIRTSL